MGKRIENFKKLKTAQKVSAAAAALLTAAVMIGLPVYAWFSTTYSLETLARVKEPTNLDIRAGHFNSIINFELSDIDLESMEDGAAEYRVFSVNAGDYNIPYRIQLAHTTNIPFKYSLYYARELESNETPTENSVAYKPIYRDPDDQSLDGTTYYYDIFTTRDSQNSPDGKINLTLLNGDTANTSHYGRILAKNDDYYYGNTYDQSDDPEVYAVPLYWRSDIITPLSDETGNGGHDYFILKIEWDREAEPTNFSKWNKAENNKETDIIYISASRVTN